MSLTVLFYRVFPLALALVLLNIGLAHHNLWPTPWIRLTPEVSVELAALVFILAVSGMAGIRIGRRAQWTLAAFLFLFVIGRYVDVTAPALFGRRIDLYWDARHIPAVFAMMAETWPVHRVLLAIGGTGLAVALLLLVLRLAVRTIAEAANRRRTALALTLSSGAFLAVYAVGMSSDRLNWERHFSIPVAPVYAGQFANLLDHVTGSTQAASLAEPVRPLPPSGEPDGRDVFILFLESYGRVALEDEAYATGTRTALTALERGAARAGWTIRSAFLTAPTFGGASWLSHASLLSGHAVRTHDAYEAFLHRHREHLADRLGKGGYRTVLLSPGIRGPWPAGLAMRFDRIMTAKDVAYSGPGFGWWYIPDQVSLEHLYRSEIAHEARAPLFVMVPTIMSHFPFGPTPPYVADWARLAGDAPYDPAAVDEALARGDAVNGDREQAYLRTILYDLAVTGGFVTERAPAGALVIALGDHQPPAAISGANAVWDVPIHVFSQDPKVLAPFAQAQFAAGALPGAQTVGGIEDMAGWLLEAISRDAPAIQHAQAD